MAQFVVNDTFSINDLRLFVLAGSVKEGKVEAGMSVNFHLNSALRISGRIRSVELGLLRTGSDIPCLCIECASDEELEMWQALNIKGEAVEVT